MAGLRRILYFDLDREARLLVQKLLAPHEVDAVASEDEARTLARQRSYDLYLISGGAPGAASIALCQWLQRVDGRTPIVFCSSNVSTLYQQAAISAGAVRYLVKPLDPTLLRSTLALLLTLAELESTRALNLAQQAVHEELVQQARAARAAAAVARERAERPHESVLRAKAYRAFREAGGNRANFERLWPDASRHAQRPRP